jgi:Peptidase MA superfamily
MKMIFLMLMLTVAVYSCSTNGSNKDKEPVTPRENINYSFPGSITNMQRNILIQKCTKAIEENLLVIKEIRFTDTIDIKFVKDREEMRQYTGMGAAGMALPEIKTMYCLADENAAPIKHELMHMITMLKWGEPHPSSTWMNEGLAAFAENNCNDYNDEQIYRFFSNKGMLLSMDSLSTNFYGQPEMISYHQCGYMVQFLLQQYGVQKFKLLWQKGLAAFDNIYGNSFADVYLILDKSAATNYPIAPEINWEVFKKGCL